MMPAWGFLLFALVNIVLTLGVVWLVSAGDHLARSAVLRGALGMLLVLLVAWVVVQTMITYTRALNGEQAWVCLNAPGCVAKSLQLK